MPAAVAAASMLSERAERLTETRRLVESVGWRMMEGCVDSVAAAAAVVVVVSSSETII